MSGSLSHSPAQVIHQLLYDLELGTSGSPWRLYYATMPDKPDNAIRVMGTVGQHQGREMIGGKVYERYGFQIMVRSTDYGEGYAKANAIAVDLDQNVNRTSVAVESSNYLIQSISRDSSVVPVGKDETSRRHLFSINGTSSMKEL